MTTTSQPSTAAPAFAPARPSLLDRLGAAAGGLWVVLALTGNGLTESDVAAQDTATGDLAQLRQLDEGAAAAGIALEVLGFAVLAFFIARLHGVLRDAEGPRAWLPTVAALAGVTMLAVKLGSGAALYAGVTLADELAPDAARLLLALNEAAFMLTFLPFGLLLVAAGLSALRSGALPRWLAWAALPPGLVAVAGSTLIGADGGPGVLGFLLGLLWVAATSVALTVRPPAPLPVAA
jgi:hypothetical protein